MMKITYWRVFSDCTHSDAFGWGGSDQNGGTNTGDLKGRLLLSAFALYPMMQRW
jgi:hypothetical protein